VELKEQEYCEPAILRASPVNFFDDPIPQRLKLHGWTCHNQKIERLVHQNALASAKVTEKGLESGTRDRITRATVDHRSIFKNRKEFDV